MWYPWGDSRWRPFATLGMGYADMRFYDEFARFNHPTMFTVPVGGGLKYRATDAFALRFDLIENIVLDGGRQSDTMNTLLIAASIEGAVGLWTTAELLSVESEPRVVLSHATRCPVAAISSIRSAVGRSWRPG